MAHVTYLGGSDEVHIVQAGVSVARGGTVEVPDAVAGRPPGDWHPRTETDPSWWPDRTGEDGQVETHDPGEGLLAQPDVWTRED